MPITNFEQLLIVLGVSLFAAIALARVRLPTIVAYLIAGACIGPGGLGWIDDPAGFTFIAEFGVVFLLFSLGLEFSLPRLLSLRGAVFGLGGAQVVLTTIVFAAAIRIWGASLAQSLVIAGALAMSSTAIVTRELSDRQQFNSRYAQLAVAVLLFQDLIAVVFLILVPVVAGNAGGMLGMQLLWALVKGLVLMAILMAAGKWLLPRIYQEVARAHADEIFVLSTLVIALLAAWLTHALTLSMALGGFIIGMMLGESPFKHQIETDIRPFKDVLLGLFFVTVGMNVELAVLGAHWLRILLFTVALIGMKFGLVTVLALWRRESAATAIRVGVTLAQAGEFGLALIVIGYLNQVVPSDQSSFTLAIAVLSMALSPLLIRNVDRLSEWLLRFWPASALHGEDPPAKLVLHHGGHVVVGGFGRVGQTIARVLDANGLPYVAIDQDIVLVSSRRRAGDNVLYGDCANVNILQQCHIDSARLAILTFRSAATAKRTIQQIRGRNISTPLIVRCSESENFDELLSLGADRVIPEMLEASLVISAQVLSLLDVAETDIQRQLDEIRRQTPGRNAG